MKQQQKQLKEPAFVSETLEWCNSIRAEAGKKPLQKMPKGEQHDPRSCPCGKAAGVSVFSTYYTKGDDYLTPLVSLPSAVRRFVQNFDAGRLVRYIK